MKSMWLETPEHRELNGNAISNLNLNENVIAEDTDAYIHEFNSDIKDLTSYEFVVGSYLIVSTSKRYAVASGRCISVQQNAIKLVLERFVFGGLQLPGHKTNILCNLFHTEIYAIDIKANYSRSISMRHKQMHRSICRI